MSDFGKADRLRIDADVDARGRIAAEQLFSEGICRAIDYRRSVESTNTLALNDLLNDLINDGGAAESLPKLFLTDQQTAGRGRHGRRWISDDETLTFSLSVPRPDPVQSAELAQRAGNLVPLAVGVGIARFLEFEFAPIRTRLKWPNDVHAGGGKVAGILMETTSGCPHGMVIGVGVNVGRAPKLEMTSETQSPRGLSDVLGRQVHRYELLTGIVTGILQAISEALLESEGIIDDFRQRCLLSGQRVRFAGGSDPCEGMCLGVAGDGALLVQTDSGTRPLHSGEATLVRTVVPRN